MNYTILSGCSSSSAQPIVSIQGIWHIFENCGKIDFPEKKKVFMRRVSATISWQITREINTVGENNSVIFLCCVKSV